MILVVQVWRHTSDGAKDFIDLLLHVDPEKRPKASEARKDSWVNSVLPLVSHKGHSSKYLSSQVSGKSGKTNGSYKSPVIRQKKVDEESAKLSPVEKIASSQKESRKYSNEEIEKKPEGNPKPLVLESNEMIKEEIKRVDLTHHFKAELLTPNGNDTKPESTITSYQVEFPSAAATEDSNSFASRAEESPCEQDMTEQDLSPVSPRCEIEDTIAIRYAMNRFIGDGAVSDDWIKKNGDSLQRENLFDLGMRGVRENTWQSPRRGELDAMFAPLQKNKLTWYMQEKTSVMEKVGMWLDEQNSYSKDERLSNSHGDIDRINRTNLQSDAHVDNNLVKYPTISAASSPVKKMVGRSEVSSFRLRQYHLQDNPMKLSSESDKEISFKDRFLMGEQVLKQDEKNTKNEAYEQAKNNIRVDFGSIQKNGKPRSPIFLPHGVDSFSLQRGEYNGDILLD